MNVFEDLIVELEEENLLEKSGIATDFRGEPDLNDVVPDEFDLPMISDAEPAMADDLGISEPVESPSALSPATETEVVFAERAKPNRKPSNGREFYQKRAMSELSNLQMVEHVLTNVEREYMKVVPKTFDDFNAKKALNAFLQVRADENSEEHTQAEFRLMQETEGWCSALAERDRVVPVSSLRLYCENSRPPLSPQAMLALARFYRNLPFSEPVRAKYDFVITRLFSKAADDRKRECIFNREETLNNINRLYNEWSSIALYGAEDDESQMLLTALSFDDLAVEIENSGGFDQLVESDYFARLRLFKESVNEMFYAPMVTASAVEANVRIGNAYVNLIDRERRRLDAESIEMKFADLQGDEISDAAGRTLNIADLLKPHHEAAEPPIEPAPAAPEPVQGPLVKLSPPEPTDPVVEEITPTSDRPKFFGNLVENAKSVNRSFLTVAVLLVLASLGIYFYSGFAVSDEVSTAGVQTVELNHAVLKEHIRTGKISGETFYGMLDDSWDGLSTEKREEYLQRVYALGREKGFTQVTLVGKNGKHVAFASSSRMEVKMP